MQPKTLPTTAATSPQAEYTNEQLMSMPLDQLDAIVQSKAENLGALQAGGGMPAAPEVAAPEAGAPVAMDLSMISSDLVMAATSKLAELGIAIPPSSEVTPELLAVLQGALDTTSPGLYNVQSNPEDLEEVLNGIANGQLLSEFGGAGAAGPGAGPDLGGAPGVGGGIPGAGAPGSPPVGGLF